MENGVDFKRVNNLANVTIKTGEPEAEDEDDNVRSIQGQTQKGQAKSFEELEQLELQGEYYKVVQKERYPNT